MDLNLPPEHEFVLHCCSCEIDNTVQPEPAKYITHATDWEHIVTLARRHGVASLILQALDHATDPCPVPQPLLDKLRQEYHATAFKNMSLVKEYHRIAEVLSNNKIGFIPLKGISFLGSIYPNIAVRPCADIDILVSKKEVPLAEKTLLASGYNKLKLSAAEQSTGYHSVFHKQHRTLSITIELHWDIDISESPYEIDIEEIFDRAAAVDEPGYTYLSPCIEDTIILNSYHIMRSITPDKIMLLKNFCDVAKIITRNLNTIDWNTLQTRLEAYRVERPVLLVLLLIQEFFDTPVPLPLRQTLHQKGLSAEDIETITNERIFSKTDDEQQLPAGFLQLFGKKKAKVLIHIPRVAHKAFRKEYDKSGGKGFVAICKFGFLKISSSLTNYFKSLFSYIFHKQDMQQQITMEHNRLKKLEKIHTWLQGSPPSKMKN